MNGKICGKQQKYEAKRIEDNFEIEFGTIPGTRIRRLEQKMIFLLAVDQIYKAEEFNSAIWGSKSIST
ncbi:MAG: hypothetical protein IPL69_10530 [Saprospiraceae bacterium]|nr:hypothetical protein [Candidatus Brachybacter algidus]